MTQNNAQNIYIQKLRYITDKNKNKYTNRDFDPDTTYLVHDSLLSHPDTKKTETLDNWKYSLYIIRQWMKNNPTDKFYFVIHYSPQAYQLYKDNPIVLFENTINTDEDDMDKITCFDTAHYFFKNRYLPQQISSNWKAVHLNGLDEQSYKNGIEKHAYPNGKHDCIGYILDEWRDYLEQHNIPYVIEKKA